MRLMDIPFVIFWIIIPFLVVNDPSFQTLTLLSKMALGMIYAVFIPFIFLCDRVPSIGEKFIMGPIHAWRSKKFMKLFSRLGLILGTQNGFLKREGEWKYTLTLEKMETFLRRSTYTVPAGHLLKEKISACFTLTFELLSNIHFVMQRNPPLLRFFKFFCNQHNQYIGGKYIVSDCFHMEILEKIFKDKHAQRFLDNIFKWGVQSLTVQDKSMTVEFYRWSYDQKGLPANFLQQLLDQGEFFHHLVQDASTRLTSDDAVKEAEWMHEANSRKQKKLVVAFFVIVFIIFIPEIFALLKLFFKF